MSETRKFYDLDKRATEKLENEEEITFGEAVEYTALAIIEMNRHSSDETGEETGS